MMKFYPNKNTKQSSNPSSFVPSADSQFESDYSNRKTNGKDKGMTQIEADVFFSTKGDITDDHYHGSSHEKADSMFFLDDVIEMNKPLQFESPEIIPHAGCKKPI